METGRPLTAPRQPVQASLTIRGGIVLPLSFAVRHAVCPGTIPRVTATTSSRENRRRPRLPPSRKRRGKSYLKRKVTEGGGLARTGGCRRDMSSRRGWRTGRTTVGKPGADGGRRARLLRLCRTSTNWTTAEPRRAARWIQATRSRTTRRQWERSRKTSTEMTAVDD